MRLKTNAARSAAALASAVYFSKKDDDNISVVLPDDLSTLSDTELAELRKDAIAAFNELYQAGEVDLTDEQEAVLGALKEAKLALDKERKGRETATAARKAKAAEYAADMADEEEAEEDAAEVVAEAEKVTKEAAKEAPKAAEKEKEVVTAAAPVEPKVISVPRIKARQTQAVEIQPVAPKSPFRAAVGVSGLAAGSELDMGQIADAFADLQASATTSPVFAAKAQNVHFSQKHQIAQIVKPFDERAIAHDDASDAIAFATDQSRLPGGSLVAAGGWCAPSATLYDLCQMESTDGILSVPEIQVTRGGVRFTQGPDWADVFLSTGFCFTEADDIAGIYGTNEVQSLTEGGAGLTSFTLTYAGNPTVSIPASTTAAFIQSALAALPGIGTGNVYVTGPAGTSTGPWTVQFVNALGDTNIAQLTSTPTGGTGTLTVATVTQGDTVVSTKPCNIVPCPSFTDVRLNVCGLCIQAGNLMNRAYPELVRRYVSGALTAHAHRVATNVLVAMIAQSDAVTPVALTTGVGADGVTSPVLSAIELQAEDIKYRYRMPRGTALEAIFPFWARGAIRADLSRRLGVEMFSVTDAQIDQWFRLRGINAQFIYNFDNLGGAGQAVRWPTSLRFLIYPAGTWVKGSSDVITISMLHDSTLNANNNFTAIFTEEGWSVMKLCHVSRIVTVPICTNGVSNAGTSFICA